MKAQIAALFLVTTDLISALIPGGTKISGGRNATKPVPYHAGIWIGDDLHNGALIDQQWVVTLSLCKPKTVESKIILGAVDITRNETTQIIVNGNPLIIHPDCTDPQKLGIALIKLEHPVDVTESVKPAKLPPKSNPSYAGEVAQATGWGRLTNTQLQLPSILQIAENPILNNSDCRKLISEIGIEENMMCMDGTDSRGICLDDIAAPLAIMVEDGEAVVVGLATFFYPLEGCDNDSPSVFTRIGSYREWIDETIQNN